jgi:hypothetical protein
MLASLAPTSSSRTAIDRSRSISLLSTWGIAVRRLSVRGSYITCVNYQLGNYAAAKDYHDLENAPKQSHPIINFPRRISSALDNPIPGVAQYTGNYSQSGRVPIRPFARCGITLASMLLHQGYSVS